MRHAPLSSPLVLASYTEGLPFSGLLCLAGVGEPHILGPGVPPCICGSQWVHVAGAADIRLLTSHLPRPLLALGQGCDFGF